uniref:Serine hydrolase-like 2 n=1 Tax=Rattus norvegicus TaxID=10116 RepID=A0ABK0LSH9_RAT
MGLLSELKLAVPWGHIAVKVWGLQKNPPVLCLHGWLDNANSFDKLIPFLPKDFCYVAMDFGGHGLSTHYSPGLPYYHHNFVSEVRRVVSAFKWTRLSLLGHSFGGVVGGLEVENIMTYRRKNIEQTLKVEDSQKPPGIFSPEEMLHELLTKNSHLNEDCGELLLQRGTTKVAEGLVLNRDQRLSWPQYSFDFMGKELTMHSLRRLQASVLIIKALDGYYDVRRENDLNKASFLLMLDILRSTLKEVSCVARKLMGWGCICSEPHFIQPLNSFGSPGLAHSRSK